MPVRDLTYACRTLRNNPSFAVAAVTTLALVIGASTAIFSVTDAVLLRPLPYKDPDRLVVADSVFSNANFFDLRDGTRAVFDDMGAVFTFRAFVPREDGSPERIHKAQVTTNFFRLMGAKVAFGQDFTAADGQPQPVQPEAGPPPGSVAILSYEYWQRRYGGNTAVLGRELMSSGQRGPQIVGVLAPGFKLFLPPGANVEPRPDVWIANNLGYDNAHRGLLSLRVIGRLKKGVSLKRAEEHAGLVAAELRGKYPDFSGLTIRLEPMHKYLVSEVRPAILSLMGAVVFLLLIACANVANLLLVRAALRERELAVRTALGGSRWRLVRQMLAEAVVLSAAGTMLGVGMAWLGIRELLVLAPADLPRLEEVAIDWRVLAFAAGAGLVEAALFGAAPAWRAARPDATQLLRAGGRTATLRAGRLLSSGVVIVEVALSFVLLIGSGLMFRSFLELQRIDPGYDPHHLLTFLLVRDWRWSQQEGREALLSEIRMRLRALPGVENASASIFFPLTGASFGGIEWGTERTAEKASRDHTADLQSVLPGYFETLRTRLIEGRTFTDGDNGPGRSVAVVDQSLAAKAFPNESAVGKRILVQIPDARWLRIIGVVSHQRLTSLAEAGREQIYGTDGFMGVGVSRRWAIRTAGDPAKYGAAVRAAIGSVDRQLLILEMQPMDAIVARAQSKTRFALLLIGTFAVISALLAGMGLYGVVSTLVRQRTAEIGIRMALGATPAGIFNLVAGHALRLSAAGIAIGLLAAFGLTRVMTAMLVGVKATDPATFFAIAVLFLVISAVASWLPARRAAGLDPTAALRQD